jgi:hypothetical protein
MKTLMRRFQVVWENMGKELVHHRRLIYVGTNEGTLDRVFYDY